MLAKHKHLFFFIIFSIINFLANGNNYAGGELTYSNIGVNQYKFQLVLFRDCSTGLPLAEQYDINFNSVKLNVSGSFKVIKEPKSGENIAPKCPNQKSKCEGGTAIGIEKYVYSGDFTIPKASDDWSFSITQCTRNAAISTITNPGGECLFLEARINSVLGSTNSSPIFTNDPIGFVGINQTSSLNTGFFEKDGNKIVSKLITPRTSKTKNVIYKSGFSVTKPFSSASSIILNSTTGDLSFSSSVEETAIVTLLVEEFTQDGKFIGSVMRDIQVISQNLANTKPLIGGNEFISICANSSTCITFPVSDPDNPTGNQKVTASVSNSTGLSIISTFKDNNTANPEVTVCFRPSDLDKGNQSIIINAVDDFCPTAATSSKKINIKVIDGPKVVINASSNDSEINCKSFVNYRANVFGGVPPFTYEWKSVPTDNKNTFSGKADSLWVSVKDQTGCTIFDTINTLNAIKIDFKLDKLCEGQISTLQGKVLNSKYFLPNWKWKINSTTELLGQLTTYNFQKAGEYTVELNAQDKFGCEGNVKRKIIFCDVPIPFMTGDSCTDINFQFSNYTKTKTKLCDTLYYTISNGVTKSTTFQEKFKYTLPGTYINTLTAENKNGCKVTYTKTVNVNLTPKIDYNITSFDRNCLQLDSMFSYKFKSFNYPFGVQISSGQSVIFDKKYPQTVISDSTEYKDSTRIKLDYATYTLYLNDSKGCRASKELKVSHPINMNIEASDYCRLGDTLTFNTSKTTYAWKPTLFKIDYGDGKIITTTKKEDITLLKRKYPTEGSFKVGIFSKDSTGCERSDTVRLNLELPVFNKINAGPICANQEFSLKSSRGRKITDISWEINNVKKINPFALKDSLSYRYWDTLHILSTAGTLYTIKQLLKYNTTCTWIDSVQSYVFPEFAIDLSIKGLCANENSVFKAVRAKGNLDVLEWNWLIKKRTNTLPYDTTLIYQAKSTIPSKVDSVFLTPKEGLAMVSVVAKNRYGCVFKKALNQQIIEMPKPCVTVSDYCANKIISLNWDCTKFNSFVNESIWDFGDNSPVLKLLGKATPEHIYPNVVKNTVYTTKLTLVNKEYNCSKDTTFAIKVLASPKGNFEIKDTCVGQDVKLIDKSVSASNDKNNLTWHLGNGKIVSNESIVSHDYGDSIKSYKPFLVVENSATGCRDTVRKEFTMRPQPKANFTFDKLNSIANKPILFKDSSSAFVRFWNYEFNDDLSSSSTEKNPKFTYNKGGIFNVKQTVQTLFGCKDEITKQINLFPYFTLPTVFSPNDDGINDVFFPIYQNIGEYKMVIFNRWGEEIFTTSSLDEGWNGTFKDEKMPFGVYIYYIKAKTLLGDDLIYEGKVTLIR